MVKTLGIFNPILISWGISDNIQLREYNGKIASEYIRGNYANKILPSRISSETVYFPDWKCYIYTTTVFSKNDFAYWLCCLGIVVYICWFILSFFIKTYLDEEGFKEITLGFWKRTAKWEDIDVMVMEDRRVFSVFIYGRGRFLVGYSCFLKDYEELTRELLQICEEKYPHIQIDPEIYRELEKAEGRKAMNQWRIEQVKKFFTRSKD